MKLIPGTPIDGSTDLLTAEQLAATSHMTTPHSTYLRAEFRGGVVTPNGTFTFNTSMLDDITAARLADITEGGFVVGLGNPEGHEFFPCLPTKEIFSGITAPSDTLREAVEQDAVSADEYADARGTLLANAAPLRAYAEVEEEAPVAVAEPIPEPIPEVIPEPQAPAPVVEAEAPAAIPAFPHDVNAVHPIDSHSLNTVVTKTSNEGYSVSHGNGAVSDGNQIAEGDPLQHLPVGSKLVIGTEGPTKIGISVPTASGPLQVSFGHRVHEAILALWAHLVAAGHAVLVDVEKL